MSGDVVALGRLVERRHIQYLLAVGTDQEQNRKDWLDWARAQFQAAQIAEITRRGKA